MVKFMYTCFYCHVCYFTFCSFPMNGLSKEGLQGGTSLRRDFKEGLEIEFTHFEGIGDISPNFELFECGRKFSTKNRLFYDKFLINGCQ